MRTPKHRRRNLRRPLVIATSVAAGIAIFDYLAPVDNTPATRECVAHRAPDPVLDCGIAAEIPLHYPIQFASTDSVTEHDRFFCSFYQRVTRLTSIVTGVEPHGIECKKM